MWEWTDIRDERATVVEDGGGRALWATVVVCCMVGRVSVEAETRVPTSTALVWTTWADTHKTGNRLHR
jgi:hypothetical protein